MLDLRVTLSSKRFSTASQFTENGVPDEEKSCKSVRPSRYCCGAARSAAYALLGRFLPRLRAAVATSRPPFLSRLRPSAQGKCRFAALDLQPHDDVRPIAAAIFGFSACVLCSAVNSGVRQR